MMDDALVEIDARAFKVSRHFVLGKARQGMDGALDTRCERAFVLADLGPTLRRRQGVFVACNKSDEIVEIDVPSWKLVRASAGPGVYTSE
jgi:hypothetical protein